MNRPLNIGLESKINKKHHLQLKSIFYSGIECIMNKIENTKKIEDIKH